MASETKDIPSEASKPAAQHAWRGVMEEMRDCLTDNHLRQGLESQEAKRLASSDVVALAQLMGGRPVYLPRGKQIESAIKHAEIYEAWAAGEVVASIARRYRMAAASVYDIVKQERERRRQMASATNRTEKEEGES